MLFKSLDSALDSEVTWIAIGLIAVVFLGTFALVVASWKKAKRLKQAVIDYCSTPDNGPPSSGDAAIDGMLKEFDAGLTNRKRSVHASGVLLEPGRILASVKLTSLLPYGLVPMAPGVLTALGLLGTFFGISAGLGGLAGKGVTNDTLNAVITGLASAFWTSIFGVGLGVVAGYLGRKAESDMEATVETCNAALEQKFAPRTPESDADRTLEELRALRRELSEIPKQLGTHFNTLTRDTIEPLLRNAVSAGVDAARGYTDAFVAKVTESVGAVMTRTADSVSSQSLDVSTRVADTASALMRNVVESVQGVTDRLSRTSDRIASGLEVVTGGLERTGTTIAGIDASINQSFQAIAGTTNEIRNLMRDVQTLASMIQGNMKSLDELQAASREHQERMANMFQQMAFVSERLEARVVEASELASESRQFVAAANKLVSALRDGNQEIREHTKATREAREEQEAVIKSGNSLVVHTLKLISAIEATKGRMDAQAAELAKGTEGLADAVKAVATLRELPSAFGRFLSTIQASATETRDGLAAATKEYMAEIRAQSSANQALWAELKKNVESLGLARKAIDEILVELVRELDAV